MVDFEVSDIQRIISQGEKSFGDRFKNYLDNFPFFDWDQLGLDMKLALEDFQYYADVSGTQKVKELLLEKEVLRFGNDLTLDNFLMTNGGTHGIFLSLFYLKKKGYKKCYIPSPSYSGYKDICELLELEYIPYNLNSGFKKNLFVEFLSEENSVLIINSPHNPTGFCISTEIIEYLKSNIRPDKCALVFDMVYDQLIYDESVINWSNYINSNSFQNCFWINSFSKNYGLPGLRLGWIISTENNITNLEPIIERNLISLSNASFEIASRVLTLDENVIVGELLNRRNYLCERLKCIKGLEFNIPKSGTSIMVRCATINISSFLNELLLDYGIGLLPGSAYYGGDGDAFRLSFGYSYEQIDDFTDKIQLVLSDS